MPAMQYYRCVCFFLAASVSVIQLHAQCILTESEWKIEIIINVVPGFCVTLGIR